MGDSSDGASARGGSPPKSGWNHGGSGGVKLGKGSSKSGGGSPSQSWSSIARDGRKNRTGDVVVSKEEMSRLKEVFADSLVFPTEEIEEARNEWRGKTLIGKFLSRRFDSDYVARALMYKWRPVGDIEIIPTVNGFYLFRFSCEDDLLRVRSGGPTVIGGAVLALEEWRENFKPNIDSISKATVWLRMPGLPSEFWKRKFVLAIASRAGNPIQVDFCTENMLKGGFARVCVEVDLNRPLVAGTPVGPPEDQIFQEFMYESIGLYCFRCGLIGHGVHECSCDPKGAKRVVARVVDRDGVIMGEVNANSQTVLSGGMSSNGGGDVNMTDDGSEVKLTGEKVGVVTEDVEITSELYGPWLTVQTRRRRAPRPSGSSGGVKSQAVQHPMEESAKNKARADSRGFDSHINGAMHGEIPKSGGPIVAKDLAYPPTINEGLISGVQGSISVQGIGSGPVVSKPNKDRNFGRVKVVGSANLPKEVGPFGSSVVLNYGSSNRSGLPMVFTTNKTSTLALSSKGKVTALKGGGIGRITPRMLSNKSAASNSLSSKGGSGVAMEDDGKSEGVKRRRNSLYDIPKMADLEDESVISDKENVDVNVPSEQDSSMGELAGSASHLQGV